MRDLVNTSESVSIKKEYWYDYNGVYPSRLYSGPTSYSGTVLRKFSGRHDITQGNFTTPMEYRAYEHTADPVYQAFWVNYTWKWLYDSYHRAYCWRRQRIKYYGKAYISPTYSRLLLDPAGFPTVTTGTYNEARTEALNKLVESEVNLSVTAGEILESHKLLQEAAARVILAYRDVKSGNYRRAAYRLGLTYNKKAMAGNYLSYQLGWKPLLNDVFNAVESIRKAQTKRERITVDYAAENDRNFPIYLSYDYEGSLMEGVQVSYTYALNDWRQASLATMGLRNPELLAWELLPKSFIIDWFISVGDVLSAMRADVGYTFLHGYETAFVRGQYTVSSTAYPGHSNLPWKWNANTFSMWRLPKGAPPKPGLYMKSGLNGDYLHRLATLIALTQA